MSRLLSELLSVDSRTFAQLISRLEHMTLQHGTDIRLGVEIITQVREKARRLGLDPTDTTPEEFYFQLLSKAEHDDEVLRNLFAITDATKPYKAAAVIAKKTQKLLHKDQVVCLQAPAVKKILKSVPPKKTLRLLHFRSIDSVLKRENPLILYAIAKRLEDKTWQKQVQARLRRLQARDVSEQSVHVLSLPEEWLEKLKSYQFSSVLQAVPEIGVVLILPTMPLRTKGSILLTTSLVLQAGKRLTMESLAYKTQSLYVGPEKLLPDIAAELLQQLEPIHGLHPSWYVVYQLVAEHSKRRLTDYDFVIGDIAWESSETRLAYLSSELDFWVNTHYLGLKNTQRPLSLHVVDVTASLVLGRKFGHQIVSHMQSSLWNEVQLRYLKHENLEHLIIKQLTATEEPVL